MQLDDPVWYVAYGSNMELSGMRHYLTDPTGERHLAHATEELEGVNLPSEWVDIPHELYFAGASKTWKGPVAFVSLTGATGSKRARGRSYLISVRQMFQIAGRENGLDQIPDPINTLDISIGAWAPLPVGLDSDGYKGKYNALLRLPDGPDSRPAYTLTTSRLLEMSPPSAAYLDRVRAGLTLDPSQSDNIPDPLTLGLGWNGSLINARPERSVRWSGLLTTSTQSRGVTSVTIPKRYSGAAASVNMAQGTLYAGLAEVSVWVFFEDTNDATISPQAYRRLKKLYPELDPTQRPLAVEIEYIRPFKRENGASEDLPDSDVIHVPIAVATDIGKWALLISEGVVGPVRVVARKSVSDDNIRVAYAARTLFAYDKARDIQVQSMRAAPANWAERLLTPFRTAGEWLFGAPAMALRATEALVGDEGRPVIRVDPGALDFIGVESGGTVVVTWGTRSVHARVLLQSELTRARMEEQFSETTGQQVRASTPSAHVESRLRTPAHLRVWVSPTVRQALNIPSDTVVRVRRSVPHLLVMNSSRLALSIAALIVGGLAVPNVHFGLWLVLSAALLMLTLAPLRLRHTRTGQSRAYRRSSRD